MKNRKLRFNAVDAILILLLAAVVFVVAYIFIFSEDESQKPEDIVNTIRYTTLIQSQDEHYDEAISVGQAVTDAIEKKSIGTVVGVQSSPMIKTTFDYESGRETESVVEGKINMEITIEAQAVETDRAFTVDGCEIRVGQQYSLMLPNFYCVGYCIDISEQN